MPAYSNKSINRKAKYDCRPGQVAARDLAAVLLCPKRSAVTHARVLKGRRKHSGIKQKLTGEDPSLPPLHM